MLSVYKNIALTIFNVIQSAEDLKQIHMAKATPKLILSVRIRLEAKSEGESTCYSKIGT